VVTLFVPPVVPTCDGITLSQNSGRSNYYPTYTCNATLATSYRVTLTDPSGNLVEDYTSNT
jgi:hypothetical protein